MRQRLGQRVRSINYLMLEHSELLPTSYVLRDTVKVVDGRHCTPAKRQHARILRADELEKLLQLGPVLDLLEGEVLNRRPRHDEPVEPVAFDLAEALVKFVQVSWRRVFAAVVVWNAPRYLNGGS